MALNGLFEGLAGGLGGLGRGLRTAHDWEESEQQRQEAQRRWDAENQMRQRAQDQQFLMQNLEYDQGAKQFEENKALQRQQMQQTLELANRARDQQRFDTGVSNLRQAGAQAGVNYLDPERAYQMKHLMESGLSLPTMGGGSQQMVQANPSFMQGILRNVDSTARSAAGANIPGKMVPGTDAMGGIYLENKQFNPYTGRGGGTGGNAQNLTREIMRVKTEARRNADAMFQQEMRGLSQMASQFDAAKVAELQAQAAKRREDAYQAALQSGAFMIQQQFGVQGDLLHNMMGVGAAAGPPTITIPTRGGAPLSVPGNPNTPVQNMGQGNFFTIPTRTKP